MRTTLFAISFLAATSTTLADVNEFSKGPVFSDFGPVADVETTQPLPSDTVFKHSFDVSTPAPADKLNATFVSAARFMNMHARSGVAVKNMHLAIVVHGKAVNDVSNANAASAYLIGALTEQGVRVIVCGQSAAYYGNGRDDLLPNVEMQISAMTAHALLQQQGYTLNPF